MRTTKTLEMTTMWTVTRSPIGDLRVVARDGSIAAIEFSPFRASPVGAAMGERADRDPLLRSAVEQLAAYFARDLKDFDLPLAPRGSDLPAGPGSSRSAGVSRMPITRRHPAMAFCASVSTWVPICTGPTNSVTRNAKASTWPEVISPARPSQMPTISTPALASPAETPPSEKLNAVSPWALVAATWLTEIAESMRSWVRFSIA